MTNVSKERVRYIETDAMRVVHHATYLAWMEIGRTNLLRDVGLPYRELEEKGVMLPVAKLGIKYVAPAFYDDPVVVYSTCTLFTKVRMRIDYRIYREEEGKEPVLLALSYTEHAIIDSSSRKIKKAPDFLVSAIRLPDNPEEYINKI